MTRTLIHLHLFSTSMRQVLHGGEIDWRMTAPLTRNGSRNRSTDARLDLGKEIDGSQYCSSS